MPPGNYRLAVKAPAARTKIVPVEVVLARQSGLAVPLELFGFFGSVRINGKPLASRLLFESGEARSDESGAYVASLAADPLTSLVEIQPCSGGTKLTFVPRERITPNGPFDIDLNVVPLRIRVLGAGGDPVAATSVRYAAVKKTGEPDAFYPSRPVLTDHKGEAVFDGVPGDELLTVCATHASYTTKCNPAQKGSELANGTLIVQLAARGLHGTVTGHEGAGHLAIVGVSGEIVEQVVLAADGSFTLERVHGAPEYAVYTSDRRPLAVMPLVMDAATGELRLTPPPGAIRSFRLTMPDMTNHTAFVGIWIGGAAVPLQVLAWHQEARSHDVEFRRGGALVVQDIVESGAIEVAAGALTPNGGFVAGPRCE